MAVHFLELHKSGGRRLLPLRNLGLTYCVVSKALKGDSSDSSNIRTRVDLLTFRSI